MDIDAILKARQTAGQRWKLARIWHKAMCRRMNEVLGPACLEVWPFGFDDEVNDRSLEQARSEEYKIRYCEENDTVELGFIVLFQLNQTGENFLTVRFRTAIRFDETTRKCQFTTSIHPAGKVLESAPIAMDPTQHQPEVPNFAIELTRSVISLASTSRTWMRSLTDPLHLQFPDSWLSKPKRQFKITLAAGDRSFEGLMEEC